MSRAEEPERPEAAREVWLSQQNEEHAEPAFTADQLCAIAAARKRLNARVTAATVVVVLVLAVALLYNVYRIDQPWLRLGQAWTLAALAYLFAPAFRGRHAVRPTDEPCARFLEREHEHRRLGYIWIRRRLWLFVPGIAACWLGQNERHKQSRACCSSPQPPWPWSCRGSGSERRPGKLPATATRSEIAR